MRGDKGGETLKGRRVQASHRIPVTRIPRHADDVISVHLVFSKTKSFDLERIQIVQTHWTATG